MLQVKHGKIYILNKMLLLQKLCVLHATDDNHCCRHQVTSKNIKSGTPVSVKIENSDTLYL